MKAVILAGGTGSRLSEETHTKPKPMVEIGSRPILWHIMKHYSVHGINDFIICCGYKGYLIKEYFANYFLHMSDVTFDMKSNEMEVHQHSAEPWRVTLIDTGTETQTGGRIKRIAQYVDSESEFCLTYGDGVANVDVQRQLEFHRKQNVLATVTAVHPPGRFGAMKIVNNSVVDFHEKPRGDGERINGGFFILSPLVLQYIEGDESIWERQPMERLANDGQIAAFNHDGFWQPMDTLREKNYLEDLWKSNRAPWKTW